MGKMKAASFLLVICFALSIGPLFVLQFLVKLNVVLN